MKLVTDCAPQGACKRATERSSALGESQILGGPQAETVKREQHGGHPVSGGVIEGKGPKLGPDFF